FTSTLSRSLLVLIDGRSVYSPLFAGVYWDAQDVVLNDIERIEVIRGPGATLWGANAVNGVINVITKSARATEGTYTSVRAGNEERLLATARYGGRTSGGVSFRTYAKYSSRDAAFHPDGDNFDAWQMAHVGFRADADPGDRDHVTVQGDLYDATEGQRTVVTTYSAPFMQTVRDDTTLSGGNLLGQWKRRLHEGSDTSLQFYYDRTNRHTPTFIEDRDTLDLEFQHHLLVASRHDLLWGAGYRWTSGRTGGVSTIQFLPADRTDDVLNAFVQDEIRLVPSRWTLTLGSKFEHNDYSGFNYQPNARLLFSPAPKHVFWSAVSRALRVPSRVEADLSVTALLEPFTPTFIRLQGNKDFEPERLNAYEMGYRTQPMEHLFLDLSLFYDDYTRLLSLETGASFTETSPAPSHSVVPIVLGNGIGAAAHGAELAFAWRPVASWRLSGSYSFLSMNLTAAENSTDATTAPGTEGSNPRHLASLRSSLDLPRSFALNLTLRYVSGLPSQKVDGYTEADLSISRRLTKGLEIALSGQNLLSPHHAEFGGGSGGTIEVERSVYGRLVGRW
ncbi:MAG: TonB-dependent receptor, partial [Acidobacteria bacterium]